MWRYIPRNDQQGECRSFTANQKSNVQPESSWVLSNFANINTVFWPSLDQEKDFDYAAVRCATSPIANQAPLDQGYYEEILRNFKNIKLEIEKVMFFATSLLGHMDILKFPFAGVDGKRGGNGKRGCRSRYWVRISSCALIGRFILCTSLGYSVFTSNIGYMLAAVQGPALAPWWPFIIWSSNTWACLWR